MNELPIKNWIPYKFIKSNGAIQCLWLNTFGKQFTEPFFDETIIKCKSMDSRQSKFSSVSDLTMIKEWGSNLDSIEPAAFIFHISRCGSTLVSQLLATFAQNIVLSEVPFFDDILRLPFKELGFDQTNTSELLSFAIKFYGQQKTGQEQRLFIKTDSWHIFFYKQLRRLYPSVPFILIYRSPDEVFRSHSKIPGMQAVPGLIEPQLFDLTTDGLDYERPDIYLANVLESYFTWYLEIAETDDLILLLNYNEGPITMIKKIASITNTELSPEDVSIMIERSLYHSKKPGEIFSEETSNQIPSCLNKVMELYYTLEEKRMAIY